MNSDSKIQGLRKFMVSVMLTAAIFPQIANAAIADQSNTPQSASSATDYPRPTSASAHWSLPFDGELNGKPTEEATLPSDEKTPTKLATDNASPAQEHPYPVAVNYHVLTLSTPLLQEVESPPVKSGNIIKAHVSAWDGPIDVSEIINYLVDKNFATSPQAKKLDQQVQRLQKLPAKTMAVTKDTLQHALSYQGFDPSVRASKLILDKKYDVRNNAWAEYERQKYVDQIHLQVVTSMMQIAEGLGLPDPARGNQLVSLGKDALETVVGPDEATQSVKGLKTWLNSMKVPEGSFAQIPWSTIDRNKKLEDVVRTAIKKDPVVTEVTKKLEHYSNPGKVKAASAHVIETTLNGIALLSPGFAIPLGAVAAESGFQQTTGGTEENKLERELLLDKRIQSRLKVVSQEAALALDNYRFALVTKNPSLLVFAQEMLGNMTGSTAPKIVSSQANISNYTEAVPPLR